MGTFPSVFFGLFCSTSLALAIFVLAEENCAGNNIESCSYQYPPPVPGGGGSGGNSGTQCKDQVDACSQFGTSATTHEFCCTFKGFANATCSKTCKFCTETSVIPINPIQGVPSVPVPGLPTLPGGGGSTPGGGGGGTGNGPTIVTWQDPCDVPSKPPGVGVGGVPGG